MPADQRAAKWLAMTATTIAGTRTERSHTADTIASELAGVDDADACYFALGLIDALAVPLIHDFAICN